MVIWKDWHEAYRWCEQEAMGDCCVLAGNWYDKGTIGYPLSVYLKWEYHGISRGAFFYKGPNQGVRK